MRGGPSVETGDSLPNGSRQSRGWTPVVMAAAVCVSFAGPAEAQWGGWGRMGGYASTAGQAADYGMAQVIRSQGYANLQNSEAAKNYEDARSKYLDNRLKGTKTYFEMRRYNKEYRQAEEGPRPTSEQLFRLAKDATPKALTPTELDPVTGNK